MIDPSLIHDAQRRLKAHLHTSPLLYAHHLSKECDRKVWLKLETLHPTHSFKVRPAFNNLLIHLKEAKAQGIVTSSSGNFAQAVAYAANELGVDAQIVMMSITAPLKIEKTNALGATVVMCGDTYQSRWDSTHQIQKETGRLLLHPYDSEETIAGDGTIGLELLAQLDRPFTTLVPVSGGGLLAGISSAIKAERPDCMMIGIQPAANSAMARSLAEGKRVNTGKFTTIADALTASFPGERTFEIIQKTIDSFHTVDETSIAEGVLELYHHQKLVVEAGGAVGVAALLSNPDILKQSPHEDIVCVLSGGNIAHETLHRWNLSP